MDGSLKASRFDAEFIVVDDGSNDNTLAVLEDIREILHFPLLVIAQENQGRFLARWNAAQSARSELLLILDSRVITHARSMEYLFEHLSPSPEAWNGHVITDPQAALIGHFWTLPTFLFWSSYLSSPHPMLITPANFDRVPKGTTILMIPKQTFIEACVHAWPEGDARLVSDDTKVLRYVADNIPLRLDPGFSATYIPRTRFRPFIKHSFDRGTLFVDSYAGTSPFRTVMLFALGLIPPLLLLSMATLGLAGLWQPVGWLAITCAVVLLLPAIVGVVKRVPPRAILSYLTYILPFGVAFWGGIARGLTLHRRSLRLHSSGR